MPKRLLAPLDVPASAPLLLPGGSITPEGELHRAVMPGLGGIDAADWERPCATAADAAGLTLVPSAGLAR